MFQGHISSADAPGLKREFGNNLLCAFRVLNKDSLKEASALFRDLLVDSPLAKLYGKMLQDAPLQDLAVKRHHGSDGTFWLVVGIRYYGRFKFSSLDSEGLTAEEIKNAKDFARKACLDMLLKAKLIDSAIYEDALLDRTTVVGATKQAPSADAPTKFKSGQLTKDTRYHWAEFEGATDITPMLAAFNPPNCGDTQRQDKDTASFGRIIITPKDETQPHIAMKAVRPYANTNTIRLSNPVFVKRIDDGKFVEMYKKGADGRREIATVDNPELLALCKRNALGVMLRQGFCDKSLLESMGFELGEQKRG